MNELNITDERLGHLVQLAHVPIQLIRRALKSAQLLSDTA